MTAEATARARRSKRVGRDAENRVAALFGTKRYPANTGGSEDLFPLDDGLHFQVKAGSAITMATIIDGLDAARIGAASRVGLGCCVVEYHRSPRNRTLIVFDAKDYVEWCGYGTRTAE